MSGSKYKSITAHGHPNARPGGKIYEHVFVMSEMLGRPLTDLEVVHHKDEDKGNNHPDNLMLFATQQLHLRFHAEQRALEACGESLFMKCTYCQQYDNPANMTLSKIAYQAHHKECSAAHQRARQATPEGRAKANEASRKAKAKMRATPEGKVVRAASDKAWRLSKKLKGLQRPRP